MTANSIVIKNLVYLNNNTVYLLSNSLLISDLKYLYHALIDVIKQRFSLINNTKLRRVN